MNCPNCAFPNRVNSKFCARCGRPLPVGSPPVATSRAPRGVWYLLIAIGAVLVLVALCGLVALGWSTMQVALPTATLTLTVTSTATATLLPTSTPFPTPTQLVVPTIQLALPTARPIVQVCPANPVLLQVNNYLEVGMTLDLSGPTSAHLFVPSSGYVRACVPQGSYSYTITASGYAAKTDFKSITQEPGYTCTHWDWWPATASSKDGPCSENSADYSPP